MTELQPEICVVIPTHNRSGPLLKALEALGRQTIAPTRFQVVVSLDAVTDGSAAALAARDWPFALRQTVPPGRGAAAARNAGAGLAQAGRLVFLDDDIIVDPGFLDAHLSEGRNDPGAVVVGQSVPAMARQGWFADSLWVWWTNRFRDLAAPGHRFDYMDLMSGNFSIDRALFERLGGFDSALGCREDYEFGYRLIAAGVRIRYAAHARGMHHDASNQRRSIQRARAEGVADTKIARKHPELFPYLMAANLTAPMATARVLRLFAFQLPRFSGFMRDALASTLPILETLRLRRLWKRASRAIWAYSYHSGVVDALGNPAALDALATKSAAISCADARAAFEIELTNGIDVARKGVASACPNSIEIRVGGHIVAGSKARPGLESLNRRHLDTMLEENIRVWSPGVMAASRLAPLPKVPMPARTQPDGDWVSANSRSALGELDLVSWRFTPRNDAIFFPMRVLVRYGPCPLGWIFLDTPPVVGAFWTALRDKVVGDPRLCGRLLVTLAAPQSTLTTDPVGVSVVICTRDRTDLLKRCLAAVAALDYPDFEVIVVDNAPRSDATRRLVAAVPSVRYVCEARPGLDWARNRGLAEARMDVIAFTDDDTEVDRHWLSAIAAAFVDPGVAAVTGLVLPMKLDTAAQCYFEDVYGGMGKGFDPATWNRQDIGPCGTLWASRFGVGANMAFRRAALAQIGAFDPALDVGTLTRGGGDIEMFHRVLASGASLAYAPAAVVWHEHRGDMGALRNQLRDNGSGFAAYLLAAAQNRKIPRTAILSFALRDWIWGWLIRRFIRPGHHSRRLILTEMSGLLRGPSRYRRARAAAQQLAASDQTMELEKARET